MTTARRLDQVRRAIELCEARLKALEELPPEAAGKGRMLYVTQNSLRKHKRTLRKLLSREDQS